MESPRLPKEQNFDAERIWQRLTEIVQFGDRLDFVQLAFDSPDLYHAWHAALCAWCGKMGQPFHEPLPGHRFLDWLENERHIGQTYQEIHDETHTPRERTVYWGLILPDDDERYIFARLNENRDNLVRALHGVLFLAGYDDFVRRFAYGAPSIWAMTTASYSISSPPPSELAVPVNKLYAPPFEFAEPEPKFDVDVFVSAADRDVEAARELADKLAREKLKVKTDFDVTIHDGAISARFVVVLLSRWYMISNFVETQSRLANLGDNISPNRARIIPIRISEKSPSSGGGIPYGTKLAPGVEYTLDVEPLDFRKPAARARNYARLVRALRRERDPFDNSALDRGGLLHATNTSWMDAYPSEESSLYLHDLADALAAIHTDAKLEIRRLWNMRMAKLAGMSAEQFDWNKPALHLWRDFLETAAKHGHLRIAIDELLTDPRLVHEQSTILRNMVGL